VKAKVRGPNDATDARMDDAMSHGDQKDPQDVLFYFLQYPPEI